MPELTPDAGTAYVEQERAAGRDPFRAGQRNAAGRLVCGGKSKRRQAPCLQTIICGNGRCRMHNGKAARGIAHSQYKHGRYAETLPLQLRARYEASVTDPELLNLSAEIAVVDARVADLFGRVDTGESTRRWRELGKKRADFLRAQRRQDELAMRDLLADILNAIPMGQRDWETWAEIMGLLEQRRRLVESEQKRRVQMHFMVKVEEATEAMLRLADAVRDAIFEHVSDGSIRRLVLNDVQSTLDQHIVGGGTPAALGGD